MKRTLVLLFCLGLCGCAVNNETLIAQENTIQEYLNNPDEDALIVVTSQSGLNIPIECQVGVNSLNNPSGNTGNHQTGTPFVMRIPTGESMKKNVSLYNSVKPDEKQAFILQITPYIPIINVSCQSMEGGLNGKIYFDGKIVTSYESPSNVGMVAMMYKLPLEELVSK
ncbi:MAG: hypothetical protein HQL12_03705 [Candidatus Omnitrophica bacterium]|nr:hypothetical protein [Candidatus Omnitrophota bacterium]